MPDQSDIDQMTHWAPQPNPAQPIVDAVAQYLHGGVPEVLQSHGYQMPDWVNSINSVLHSQSFNDAAGMMPGGLGALTLKRFASMGLYDRIYHMMNEEGSKVGKITTSWKPHRNELYVSGMQSDLPTTVPGTEAARANDAAHSLGLSNIRSVVEALKKEYPKAESITALRTSGGRYGAAANRYKSSLYDDAADWPL